MKTFYILVIGALSLSIAITKTEDSKRVEEVTTQESIESEKVNSSKLTSEDENIQQPEDSDKPRNVRDTQSIASQFFVGNPWSSLETPMFFEPSVLDKEKSKLVLIEPFFRVKKEQKGFWGWMKKIFGQDKEKMGQGPLIGPVKVPGMGDNVYIRAMEPLDSEADHVVIHLMTNQPEKEIKFESHLPLISFDNVHEIPVESTNFQTIVSPHFSHEGLLKQPHFPVLDASWPSVQSHPVHFPSAKENVFSSPSLFRKHSTDGHEFSGTFVKDTEGSQQHTAWAQPVQHNLNSEIHRSNQKDLEQLHETGFYGSENNRQFSSARDDIDNLQRTQTSQLELSENKELPLYPPLFNASFGQNNSNNREQTYITNDKNSEKLRSPSGLKRDSKIYPGLGAYRTELKFVNLPPINTTDVNFEEEYFANSGIQEVEAPNLSQAKHGKISVIDSGLKESIEGSKNNLKNVETSKRIRNSHSSDYGNYGVVEKNPEDILSSENQNLNETDTGLKTISASYPWEYRVSKNRVNIPTTEDDKREVLESSDSNSQVQAQPETQDSSITKSRFSLEEELKRNVRNELRFKNRPRSRSRGREIKKQENVTLDGDGKNSRENTSKIILENDSHEIKSETEKFIVDKESIENGKNCSNFDCWEDKEKEDKETLEMKKPLTPEKVKDFFLKESKRFEELLKAVEEESKTIKEEAKKAEKEEIQEANKEETIKPVKEEMGNVRKGTRKAIKEKSVNFKNNFNKNTKVELKSVEKELKDENESKVLEEESKVNKKNNKSVLKEVEEELKGNEKELGFEEISNFETEEAKVGKETKEQKESRNNKKDSTNIRGKLKTGIEEIIEAKLKTEKEEQELKSDKKDSNSELKITEEKLKIPKEPLRSKKRILSTKLLNSPEKKLTLDIKNMTRFDIRSRKSNEEMKKHKEEEHEENKHNKEEMKENQEEAKKPVREETKKPSKEEMKKSNATVRLELKKPIIKSTKMSIKEGRFKNKFKNNTYFGTSNSTLKSEMPNTTPPTHILRMNTKNRSTDKLKYNTKKQRNFGSGRKKEFEETQKSVEGESKVEKPKIERVRISKFKPRSRYVNQKIDTKTTTAASNEFEIKI